MCIILRYSSNLIFFLRIAKTCFISRIKSGNLCIVLRSGQSLVCTFVYLLQPCRSSSTQARELSRRYICGGGREDFLGYPKSYRQRWDPRPMAGTECSQWLPNWFRKSRVSLRRWRLAWQQGGMPIHRQCYRIRYVCFCFVLLCWFFKLASDIIMMISQMLL